MRTIFLALCAVILASQVLVACNVRGPTADELGKETAIGGSVGGAIGGPPGAAIGAGAAVLAGVIIRAFEKKRDNARYAAHLDKVNDIVAKGISVVADAAPTVDAPKGLV